MDRLRLVFMGTPAFSVPALAAVRAAGHDVVAVYCQPPKPAGRGQKEQKSPVQEYAERDGIPVRTPKSLRNGEEQAGFAALKADAAVVVAYGLILPREILMAPRLGCLNIHASLLPRWRGAAPIQRAMLAGDHETGITIMQMDEGLDTGPMLLAEKTPITENTTATQLHDTLAAMGAGMITRALVGLAQGTLHTKPQPVEGMTYAAKLARADGAIDWAQPAAATGRQVRALNPWPGTFCKLDGETIKVLAAAPAPGTGAPGTLLDDQCTVACGEGALRLLTVQRPGKAPVGGGEFLRGARLASGAAFGNGA
ncbi:MAG: methionyl-tRNA formyltransferase [Alphaproteobacteria bacterium]|nr:methionyl-tRNA formyltransferase [Alphaproteobacteria bacterium]